ncbi:hypothetical protein PENFLA_c018G05658 [Penicillium flavigenum]|uniref:Uncharacterized protein n=1 Tax=Penicillium flavigenum TaxID=254877 RepID=A0A1V6T1L3_9EURO|nr:hypothetical protein PENFLA_c018G05658 [Penicillium flavigenum]
MHHYSTITQRFRPFYNPIPSCHFINIYWSALSAQPRLLLPIGREASPPLCECQSWCQGVSCVALSRAKAALWLSGIVYSICLSNLLHLAHPALSTASNMPRRPRSLTKNKIKKLFTAFHTSQGICRPVEADVVEATDALLALRHNAAVTIRTGPKRQLLNVPVPMKPIDADDLDGAALDKFPVWEKFIWLNKQRPIWPHFVVKSSDEWVYVITKFLSTKLRAAVWRMDFTQNGDVRRDRTNFGKPVIAWAYGIPWVAVSHTGHMLGGSAQQWGPIPLKTDTPKDWRIRASFRKVAQVKASRFGSIL